MHASYTVISMISTFAIKQFAMYLYIIYIIYIIYITNIYIKIRLYDLKLDTVILNDVETSSDA